MMQASEISGLYRDGGNSQAIANWDGALPGYLFSLQFKPFIGNGGSFDVTAGHG
jgi:hypothetical protein